MNEDFIFRLGADVSSFTKSITEVEAELKSARAAVKGALGDDLIQANKYVEDLEQSLKNLKSVGVQVPGAKAAATELAKLPPAAQKAQNTLTGLSGVVRDLPFGFIAIQNNLPILADQFSALSKESGGVGGAIESLGEELIGPAGAAFAFGAVTSIVTTLIQKYGSLGNAIKAFTVQNQALVDAQEDFEAQTAKVIGSIAVEETKINSLTKALLDAKTPRKDQIAYYEELKKIAPEVVAGISAENIGTNDSNKLLTQNIALRAESLKLQIQEAGIKAVASKNSEALAIATKKEADAKDKLAQAEKDFKQFANASVSAGSQQVSTYADAIKYAKSEISDAQYEIKQLTEVQNKYLSQLDPITLRVAEINNVYKKQNDTLKESNKETETAKTSSERRTKQLANEQKALEKKTAAELKAIEVARQQRTLRVTTQVQFDLQGRGQIDTSALLKKRIKETEKQVSKTAGGIQIPLTFPAVDPLGLLNNIKLSTAEFEKLKKAANLEAATRLLSDTFFNPVQNLFSDLISGSKTAFKDFTKAILQAINQIVAKIIATGIISLLANLLFPGAGGAGVSLGKKVLGDIFGAFGFKGVANPNFGGIGAGGMQMSGAVNVVLRGQDLVGALNRTNAQINRVG